MTDIYKKLYRFIINKENIGDITIEELIEIGYNAQDINSFVKNGVIAKTSIPGHYSFIYSRGLSDYAISLNETREFKKMAICLKKCLQIDPNDVVNQKRMFYRCILDKNFEGAVPYLIMMFKSQNSDRERADNNFYLYTLSFIVKLPENIDEYTSQITCEDLLLDINEAENKFEAAKINKLRELAYDGKWEDAKIKNLEIKSKININSYISDILLSNAKKSSSKELEQTKKLIFDRRYDEVVEQYSIIAKQRHLSEKNYRMLYLIKLIKKVKQDGYTPEAIPTDITTINNLIKTNNFEEALLTLREERKKQYFTTYTLDILEFLLDDLISEINKQKDKKKLNYNLSSGEKNE